MSKNKRNTTAKEQMLKSIRQALLQKREHPFPLFEDAALFQQGGEAGRPLAVQFAERFTKAGGQFVYCEDSLQLAENLLNYIELNQLNELCALEPDVQGFLAHFGFPFSATKSSLQLASATIATCEALLARQGSILLSGGTALGRQSSVTASQLLVFARTSQLALDLPEAYDKALAKIKAGGEAVHSLFSSAWIILHPCRAEQPAPEIKNADVDGQTINQSPKPTIVEISEGVEGSVQIEFNFDVSPEAKVNEEMGVADINIGGEAISEDGSRLTEMTSSHKVVDESEQNSLVRRKIVVFLLEDC